MTYFLLSFLSPKPNTETTYINMNVSTVYKGITSIEKRVFRVEGGIKPVTDIAFFSSSSIDVILKYVLQPNLTLSLRRKNSNILPGIFHRNFTTKTRFIENSFLQHFFLMTNRKEAIRYCEL